MCFGVLLSTTMENEGRMIGAPILCVSSRWGYGSERGGSWHWRRKESIYMLSLLLVCLLSQKGAACFTLAHLVLEVGSSWPAATSLPSADKIAHICSDLDSEIEEQPLNVQGCSTCPIL